MSTTKVTPERISEARKQLKAMLREYGSMSAVGREIGVTGQSIAFILQGHNPGKKTLAGLDAYNKTEGSASGNGAKAEAPAPSRSSDALQQLNAVVAENEPPTKPMYLSPPSRPAAPLSGPALRSTTSVIEDLKEARLLIDRSCGVLEKAHGKALRLLKPGIAQVLHDLRGVRDSLEIT